MMTTQICFFDNRFSIERKWIILQKAKILTSWCHCKRKSKTTIRLKTKTTIHVNIHIGKTCSMAIHPHIRIYNNNMEAIVTTQIRTTQKFNRNWIFQWSSWVESSYSKILVELNIWSIAVLCTHTNLKLPRHCVITCFQRLRHPTRQLSTQRMSNELKQFYLQISVSECFTQVCADHFAQLCMFVYKLVFISMIIYCSEEKNVGIYRHLVYYCLRVFGTCRYMPIQKYSIFFVSICICCKEC